MHSIKEISELVLKANNFSEFNVMQKKALKKDLFNNNVVISAPTSSGKTIIAELLTLNSVLNKKKKVLYVAPLKALASEHYHDFKKKYAFLNIRFALSTGDFDSSSKYLSQYDVIFLTNEKLDSLLRHNALWLKDSGLLIIDEIHEIDSDRGATLEIIISKMLLLNPRLQLLALSATIPNAKEIAEWLKAILIESNYRPIKLREGILFDYVIDFNEGKQLKLNSSEDELIALLELILSKGKQALIFMQTRAKAESLSEKLSFLTEKTLNEKEKIFLKNLSTKALNVLEIPSKQCEKLAKHLLKGIAFHHAGLLAKQRKLIEDAFRERKIKILVATPTLAAGINMPAFAVIIPSLYRYSINGMHRISVREVKQWLGRAGRPKYDSEGLGIIIARSELEKKELFEKYINGELEDITSRLAFEPILRMHLLALIANNYIYDLSSAEKFFSKTFYSIQYNDLSEILFKVEEIVKMLHDFNFIEFDEKKEKFRATLIGKRVSELYLDPISGKKLIDSLQLNLNDFGLIFSLVQLNEFYPFFSVPKSREQEIFLEMLSRKKELPLEIESEQYTDYDLLDKFFSSMLFFDWINEKKEQTILDEFNVQPGMLYAKTQILDWLSYSAIELAKTINLTEKIKPLSILRQRLKHGIKPELLELVELKGIGRVRARKLFNAGIKSINEVKKADLLDLAKIIGLETAKNIKKQLKQV